MSTPELDQTLQQQAQEVTAAKQYACPECAAQGITFIAKNSQGLARHRAVKHGVAGKSTASKKRRQKKTNGSTKSFSKSRLLATITPNGMIPVGELERVTAWLKEGEAIYKAVKR